MALGDNTAFFNETTFGLGDEQTSVTGVSGISVSDDSGAKVLFTKLDSLNSVTVTTSAIIAVINSDRLSTQFTFDSTASSAFQTASAEEFNSVGPTLRRLYQLGYV